jgi:ribosomal protein L37AE/L43A
MSENKFDPVELSKQASPHPMAWGRYLDMLKDDFLLSFTVLSTQVDNKNNDYWFLELPESVQAKLVPALNNVLLGLYDYLVMHSTPEQLSTAIGNLLYLAQLDPEFISISGLTAAIEKFIKRVVAPYLFRSKKINIARCKECGQLFAQKRANQVFCCTSCNNKCKGKVYREKHLRVKRKEHEHD